ncbi:MAG: diguanylate cyclase [Candidatus Sericytochromatia bacterium]|nr:diguanylate cyclase [Candidatus Sericytochromatia bacterium]
MTSEVIASRYRVIKKLGEGGMGLVNLVEDTTTHQEVALKVLSSKLGASEEAILQFKQEFRQMAALRHPNCCAVYDFGQLPDGSPFLTMEVVPGQGLDEMLPLDNETFRSVFSQLMLALGYLHQQGFVHCDIKDENARVRPDGEVRLMDFGLMERAGGACGTIKGTLGYMAPEMARGGRLDQRVDLYSMGCLGYQMLAGRLPFTDQEPVALIQAHLKQAPTPLRELNPQVDPVWERVIHKLLEKDAPARYQSAYDVLEDLGIDVGETSGAVLLSPSFVGRAAELDRLSQGLERLSQGLPAGALLLSGPAGVGKSRLVNEFRFAVQMRNHPFVVGASYEQGTAPYGPFVEILRGLVPAFREHVPDLLNRQAPILVKLIPDLSTLAQLDPIVAAPDLDPPSKEKMRLQAAVSELLAGLASRRGVVLVLEDCHWADPLSTELLTYVLRNYREAPLLFLLNHRGTPEGQPAWLPLVETLVLENLAGEQLHGMVASMLGSSEIGATFLEQMAAFSEGNPFFIEKLLEHLVRNQTLCKRKGRWNSDITLTPEQMPGDLQGLLLEKLATLSEAALTIARIGAVLGRELGLDMLLRVTRLPEDRLFDALAELAEQSILVRTEEAGYRFVQGQLGEVLYANLEPGMKGQLHAAIAEALEATLGETPLSEAPLALVTAIAHHAIHAADKEKTLAFALEAGTRSANLFANQEAHRFLSAGLEWLQAEEAENPTGLPTPRQHLMLHYRRVRGDVCRVSGRSEEATADYGVCIPLAETLQESFHLGRLLTSAAKVAQMSNDYPTALALTNRSIETCQAGGDEAGAARALLTSSRILYFTGKPTEAAEHTHRALELARSAQVPAYIGEALGFAGLMYVSGDPDKLEEGENNLKEAVDILSAVGDRVGLNNAYNLLGNAQNMQGNFDAAWETFQQNKKICVEIGLRDEEIFAILNLAITAYERGQYRDTIELAREANGIATSLNSKFPLGMAFTLEACASTYLGDMSQGLELAGTALELAREIKNKYLEALVLQYTLEIQLQLGRLEQARATGQALTALIQETGNTEPESRMQAMLGEVLVRLGKSDTGVNLVTQSLEASRKARAKGNQVRALRTLAWCELQAGQLERACALAEEARTMALTIGAQHQGMLASLLQGEVLLRLGQADQAALCFEHAKQGAEALGTPLQRAAALHGLASVNPYQRVNKQRFVEAQKVFRTLLEDFDDEARRHFVSLPERLRIQGAEALLGLAPASGEAVTGGAPGERLIRMARELADLASQVAAQHSENNATEDTLLRLERVLDYAESLTELRDPEQALSRALDGLMSEVKAERAYLMIEADFFTGQIMRHIRPDGGYQADWALATQLITQARTSGNGAWVEDAPTDPRTAEAVKTNSLRVQTAMAVPVRLGQAVVGELYLDRETADGLAYQDEDLRFVSRLADQACIAVRNAARAAQMAQRSRQLEMLNQLAEKINETLVVEEVLNLVVRLTLEVTHAERGFLMLLDELAGEHQLVCKAAFDRDGKALLEERISRSICDKVLTTGQAITVVDALADEEFQTSKSIMSLNLRTLMCVPLQAKGRNLGVLYVDSQAVVSTFSERDLDLLRAIAGHSSGAIENATLYTRLNQRADELEKALDMYRRAEHEASTDVLTGLYNRRFFQDQSSREIELSKRQHRNMAVIMLDVDHFKKFNDTHGHAIGDEVLKVVGKILPQSVRASDLPCRFGGEEFVILCPDTDSPGACTVAERIREAISEVELVDLEGKPVGRITASLGVASLLPTDERVAELLERADTALYACKAGGRNQVQSWQEGMLSPEELKKQESQAKASQASH